VSESEHHKQGIISDEILCLKQLQIVEKYERFANYLYPVLQNMRRTHGVLRDKVLEAMFLQIELLNRAGKSGQVSKLYEADANLSTLRFYIRFLADPKRKLISQKQSTVSSVHLAEVGKILGAWIRSKKR